MVQENERTPLTEIQTMSTNEIKPAVLVAGVATVIASASHAAEAVSVTDLVASIKSTDDKVRGPAWQGAGPAGAPAVQPLAALMTNADYEIARSAKRAVRKIIRHAGRPGAEAEAKAVTAELLPLLQHEAPAVRREALWMLSEIGGDDAIAPMAALLSDAEVRDDARCTLTRLPGPKSLAALKSAFPSASEEFKFALADSLRARGEKVDSHPTKKLVPTRATTVGQPGAK
jgi:HEAT repeat protein